MRARPDDRLPTQEALLLDYDAGWIVTAPDATPTTSICRS